MYFISCAGIEFSEMADKKDDIGADPVAMDDLPDADLKVCFYGSDFYVLLYVFDICMMCFNLY